MNDLFQPDPSQIQNLLRLDRTAAEFTDPNMYYMAGVGANGGRMLVRSWLAETLGEVQRNVRDWYAGLAHRRTIQ